MNHRKIISFAAAGLAGVALPVAIGATASGQGPTTTTTCAPGYTAPSPYCSVTTTPGTGTTEPSGNTGTTPTTTTGGSSNSGNTPAPKNFAASAQKKFSKLPSLLKVKVTLTPAEGATCSGKIQTSIVYKKKTVGSKSATLPASCKFTLKAKLNKKKIKAGKGSLSVVTKFLGNSGMQPATAKAIKVSFKKK